jgi:hypothetical protein
VTETETKDAIEEEMSNDATTEAIGASRDPKNPPFCKIAFFFLRELLAAIKGN